MENSARYKDRTMVDVQITKWNDRNRKHTHTTPTHVKRQTDKECARGRPKVLHTVFKCYFFRSFVTCQKVKTHRGEPANEGADILADKTISDPKVGKEWCQRTNRAVFTWRKPCHEAGKVTYQDPHLIFNNSVRDALQRGAAENEVQKNMKRSLQVFGGK